MFTEFTKDKLTKTTPPTNVFSIFFQSTKNISNKKPNFSQTAVTLAKLKDKIKPNELELNSKIDKRSQEKEIVGSLKKHHVQNL